MNDVVQFSLLVIPSPPASGRGISEILNLVQDNPRLLLTRMIKYYKNCYARNAYEQDIDS